MPKLADSHLVSQRAVLAVAAILDSAGALSEQIRNDYGEDILVQTHLNNEADAFRILIQVKATRLRPAKDGAYKFRFSTSHVRRWATHLEPLLICVHDLDSGLSYAFEPQRQISIWDAYTHPHDTISLYFSEDDKFDEHSARQIIWSCRLDHFSRMLALHANQIRNLAASGDERSDTDKLETQFCFITLKILEDADILEGNGLSKQFLSYVRGGIRSTKNGELDQLMSEPFDVESLVSFSLVCCLSDKTERGIPENIINYGTRMCLILLQKYHPDLWDELARELQIKPASGLDGSA